MLARTASADTAAELEAKGQQLAKDGRYSDAIDAFKAADRIEPRASHVCLIALAYTRRELWPQAEVFLDKCHRAANDTDPLPSWVPLADQQLQERLATANVAAVTIAVSPDMPALVTVSSFAPDEKFAPRTIHLPPGKHVISVEADGFPAVQQTLDLTDRKPTRVVIELNKPVVVVPPPHVEQVVAPPRPPPPPQAHASKLPWILMGAGGAVALAGLGVHLFALEPVRDDLKNATTPDEYRSHGGAFTALRTTTIALYGVGAALIATGAVLHFTAGKHEVAVALVPTTGGAMLGFEVLP